MGPYNEQKLLARQELLIESDSGYCVQIRIHARLSNGEYCCKAVVIGIVMCHRCRK